jgi:hypothetical protein
LLQQTIGVGAIRVLFGDAAQPFGRLTCLLAIPGAILDQRRRFAGQVVATILCGGNGAEQFERWFAVR